jgi:glycosyltransferase involved in cell wall biosynthesis
MASFVSVIIPCYNQARFLREAVESALGQDYPAKEVIVINDGSEDNVREVVSRFKDKIISLEQENKGVSAARNTGIRAARGKYIAFLDSDDACLPHALRDRASYLDNNPDTALVCANSLVFYETGLPERLYSSQGNTPTNFANFRWETVDYYPAVSTVMVRNFCFAKTGYFEETLRIGGEDWHMWVRLSLHFNMAYLDHPLARYRIHCSNATSNTERTKLGTRMAAAHIVDSPHFRDYPSHFRARLLYYRFATAWRSEPKKVALAYFFRAFFTDPLQIPYGLKVIRRGVANTLRKHIAK